MNIQQTYLKNNGLYQVKYNQLILENNVTIRCALEIYNLFHGQNNKKSLVHSELYIYFASILKDTGCLKYLKTHTVAEYESMMDYLIDNVYRLRYKITN
jgi:hypothetical protein